MVDQYQVVLDLYIYLWSCQSTWPTRWVSLFEIRTMHIDHPAAHSVRWKWFYPHSSSNGGDARKSECWVCNLFDLILVSISTSSFISC
ncbi:hypothetical protein FVEG_16278 [Fusarium verticillioides 7600]|uniref:Uncharacterized protein n=1 Tax=Gibberella moniliformis (strain M3125 / FGSC 7600) TaxID=334819 RepID=W7MVM9_GIBM7|nr:hypothetical protein FVEG_16278 [Fusarium verticillioides 7600]XP_018754677.1 hypothetical protein FVEG_16278 [Fusarium verticillioides 7600]XP_018754678.1 hypothetical protein FVEG_16278 [Fusarium verticillioides 7600]EWG48485.1 hypothetical protein FVEG_16278 [Fusarium verticillioides 7600]EWG48486.1 hypothetical protein FVEG_16278 [Fusarium verticillioides 7600]EWG48487.1 hypothetical protein FVEG_16278 [Fusarium verticillioides 7600]